MCHDRVAMGLASRLDKMAMGSISENELNRPGDVVAGLRAVRTGQNSPYTKTRIMACGIVGGKGLASAAFAKTATQWMAPVSYT